MLAIDDAKRIAATWRPRFADEADFEASWTRYMETATVPDEQRLEAWLAKDCSKSEVKHAGIISEPLLPTQSRYDLNGCYHCEGRGSVRLDVPSSHPEFGKAKTCPACHGRHGDQSAHCGKCAEFWNGLLVDVSPATRPGPRRDYVGELAARLGPHDA